MRKKRFSMIERCHAEESNALFGADCDGVEGLKHRMEEDASRPGATVFFFRGIVFLQIHCLRRTLSWIIL